MFRRRLLFRRPLVRRPILGAAMFGGLGYLAGKRSPDARPSTETSASTSPATRLEELERLHAAGTITDEEYAAKHADLVRLI